jgi:hypothetical protein
VRFTEFDLTTFDDGETIEDYALRLSGMAPEQQDSEIVMKMIRSMSPRFKQITIVIKTLLNVSTMSATNLIGRLKEAEEVFEEAPTSLQQDGKLYLTEEEWDARRKKCEAVAQAKAVSAGAVAVALHQVGRRASLPVMSVGAVARWGIGHVSVA